MECIKDCPVLLRLAEGMGQMRDNLETAERLQRENEEAIARNQATAKQLASLPPSKQAAEARGALQEAVIRTTEARGQIAESVSAIHAAIGANAIASEAIQTDCPGEPYYVEDPDQPGKQTLICASPGAYE